MSTEDKPRVIPGETPLHASGGHAKRDEYGRLVYRGTLLRDEDGKKLHLELPEKWGMRLLVFLLSPEIDLSGVPTGSEIEVAGTGCSVLVGVQDGQKVYATALLVSRFAWPEELAKE